MTKISKSEFKPKALEYLRYVEQKKKPVIITHDGIPVVKVIPYTEDPDRALADLGKGIKYYGDILEPVGEDDWEVLK